ncbi:PIN domain-containing protein [Rhizobium sp. GCM10022189]|uniref:PIN domain-containing protein n=1 Tax=Rhizobium sp. GCM10022189 TaxID=3252654 RepID=UPI0036067547
MAKDVFLLDTNIICNASKTRPHPVVSDWLERQERVAIPFAVILEVETGISQKAFDSPLKAAELRDWLDGVLDTEFDYPLPTPKVARQLGEMLCSGPLKHLWYVDLSGRKKPGQDLAIAATAIVYDMPIATLNCTDFDLIDRFFPLPGVYDPQMDRWTVPNRSGASQDARQAKAKHTKRPSSAELPASSRVSPLFRSSLNQPITSGSLQLTGLGLSWERFGADEPFRSACFAL